MSARAPFVPQRSASRASERPDDSAQAKSPPSAGHETFRPNGLLDPLAPAGDTQDNSSKTAGNTTDSAGHGFASKFRPLNLSGFSKRKPDTQGHAAGKARQALDSSGHPGPQPFSAAQHARLAAPRPSSPFFQNSGSASAHTFRAPAPPAQSGVHSDEFSSNKAHIAPSGKDSDFDDHPDASGKTTCSSEHFRHRSRTVSQPSLASIHEVAEEEENASPLKMPVMGPPAVISYGEHNSEFNNAVGFSGAYQDEVLFQQGLRRPMKRSERAGEDDDEFDYGTGAKRYKAATHQDEFPGPYNGRAPPTRYPTAEFERAMTPAHGVPLLAPPAQFRPEPKAAAMDQNDPRQALFQLLGQDLEIIVEGHADSYQQSRKRWAECSAEEWTQGADGLATRFSQLLDFVKDHMTAKLALYATMETTISDHKAVLAEREKTLKEARESLVREGGAVVGGAASLGPAQAEEQNEGV
ncbi:hypothetical protein BD413DRAFT_607566 [Trametes elegans]|nr:hypothetical protein BD413DRAFT_607566 [Trametes elegans]